jgi:hypothetical protein
LRSRALERWHLLSLDAPTVATLWTWFIARVAHLALPWTELAAMFSAVWVLYALDRLLDARMIACGTHLDSLEARHFFHHLHGAAFRWGIAAGCAVLACLLPRMLAAELKLDLILGALLAGWFLVIHTVIHTGERPLPKEFVVGIFFSTAVFVPTLARAPRLIAALWMPALLFAAVCCLNCLFLFAWEHEARDTSEAHATTRRAARAVVPLTVVLILICGLRATPTVAAIALVAMLLLGLHVVRHRLARVTLRAAADLVLLTPILFAWWPR